MKERPNIYIPQRVESVLRDFFCYTQLKCFTFQT